MREIDVPALRADLERTGNLASRDDSDPGHIPAFWRKRVADLCDVLEAGATATTEATPKFANPDRAEVEALLAVVQSSLFGDLALKWPRALLLIHQAVPRMRTLNNAISILWLEMVEEFFAGEGIR